jgi:hypothetical protein
MTLALSIAALVFSLLAFGTVGLPAFVVYRRIRRLRRSRA